MWAVVTDMPQRPVIVLKNSCRWFRADLLIYVYEQQFNSQYWITKWLHHGTGNLSIHYDHEDMYVTQQNRQAQDYSRETDRHAIHIYHA